MLIKPTAAELARAIAAQPTENVRVIGFSIVDGNTVCVEAVEASKAYFLNKGGKPSSTLKFIATLAEKFDVIPSGL